MNRRAMVLIATTTQGRAVKSGLSRPALNRVPTHIPIIIYDRTSRLPCVPMSQTPLRVVVVVPAVVSDDTCQPRMSVCRITYYYYNDS